MTRKMFGTDGVRGLANKEPITPQTVLRLAMAVGQRFRRGDHRHLVVIGKDTRLSGYMLEPALTAGFVSMGMDVVLVGPLPTPAVAVMTRSLRADLGVVISASHNPYFDNGIKLFGPDGYKLSDDEEAAIEQLMDSPDLEPAESGDLGRARRLDDAQGRYIEYVKQTFPRGLRLDGLRIVVDCANGAAYKVAPTVLWELGADVVSIGVEPDGTNINRNCGATAPETLSERVVATGADLGLALDGDADRVIICDEHGAIVDGDQLMALMATRWAANGMLKGGTLVATVMSNLGLERYLQGQGLALHRTDVGDRYVVEAMRAGGWNLGGEQSGHIVMTDYATTGDGLIAGLQFMAAMVETGKPASELTQSFETVPQMLKNVRYEAGA
ncbi:MAG: phosphoglucosamine mutase, partial [Alphaproteobacteria bacterium]|nr:phosphoglucosamine mutase [Alphaproteobacteria bacterium]